MRARIASQFQRLTSKCRMGINFRMGSSRSGGVRVPTDWPDEAVLDGRVISLSQIARLPMRVLPRIWVNVPGRGRVRPWRFLTPDPEDGGDARSQSDPFL